MKPTNLKGTWTGDEEPHVHNQEHPAEASLFSARTCSIYSEKIVMFSPQDLLYSVVKMPLLYKMGGRLA